ncbi:type II secretion system protein [Alkalihalophilus marmarensis]|uniref:type II secretion system protein n=1 Tax=Alkalihalophilus marmarensis TaxID=521377 RepID=UPI002E1A5A49|nr:type II secretion system protein [Alkalihalophilus marmarensis]
MPIQSFSEKGGSIIESSSGFTLMEVILALSLLSVCTLAILPAYLIIYNERLTLQQENLAGEQLRESIQNYLTGEEQPTAPLWMTVEETRSASGEYVVCAAYTGANKRQYHRCLYAKK